MTDYYTRQLAEPSNSTLQHFRRSPMAYHDHVTSGDDHVTPALSFGRAFHLALLEPAEFARTFLELPPGKLTSTSNKGQWLTECSGVSGVDLFGVVDVDARAEDLRAAVVDTLARFGRTVVTANDLALLRAQVASLNLPDHEPARRLLSLCNAEVEIHWEELGLRPKGKIDLLSLERMIAADLKTTEDADPNEFRRAVTAYGYHYQEAMYRRGIEARYGVPARYRDGSSEFQFCFLLVGKARPHHWSWVTIDAGLVTDADDEITRNLVGLRQCIDTNQWPGRLTPEPVTVQPWRKSL